MFRALKIKNGIFDVVTCVASYGLRKPERKLRIASLGGGECRNVERIDRISLGLKLRSWLIVGKNSEIEVLGGQNLKQGELSSNMDLISTRD